MKIILDTNFMMECFHHRIDLSDIFDLFPGARLGTVSQVVQELKTLAKKRSVHGRYAKVALGLIDGFEVIETKQGKADDILAKMAGREFVIATNDGKLRRRIRKKGLKTIYLRGRKQLAVG